MTMVIPKNKQVDHLLIEFCKADLLFWSDETTKIFSHARNAKDYLLSLEHSY